MNQREYTENIAARLNKMCWVKRRAFIKPTEKGAFENFVILNYKHFLIAINFVAIIAYDLYFFADAILVPDVTLMSFLIRGGLTLIALLDIHIVFFRMRSLLLMDMLMPIHDVIATLTWFEILKYSQSTAKPTFVFASLIFVILANLGVRYSITAVFIISLIISGIIIFNLWLMYIGDYGQVIIFVIIYLPILAFSLFISWVNIHWVRKAYHDEQEKLKQQLQLTTLNHRLNIAANTDTLTGIGNRRAFDLALSQSWERYRDSGICFSLLLADIEYFKSFNDHYGHQSGDQCLRLVAEALSSNLRKGEGKVFRYGGEEFAIVSNITSRQDLGLLAERLRNEVAALPIAHLGRPDGLKQITISMGGVVNGVALCAGQDRLIEQCDKLLYRAKRQGRNCILLQP